MSFIKDDAAVRSAVALVLLKFGKEIISDLPNIIATIRGLAKAAQLRQIYAHFAVYLGNIG